MFTFSIAVPRSPSTRRAWIEILRKLLLHLLFGVVALHPEGVDRNNGPERGYELVEIVALHPEGVDRNRDSYKLIPLSVVALHPEGVDRNRLKAHTLCSCHARRPPPGGRG